MITEGYKKYIRSDKWKRKRQQALAHYGRRCYACRKGAKVLHVHHLSYIHLGNEPMGDLMILCKSCHERVTKFHRKNRRAGIRRNTAYMIKVIRKQQGTSL